MTITENELIEKLKQSSPDLEEMEIKGDTSFKAIALDSMDKASFMLEIEESYGIKISNEEISKFDSINQVANFLSSTLA